MTTRLPASDQIEVLLDQAEEALEEGRAEDALTMCERVLGISPSHAGAHFVRGDALQVLGQLEEANEAYRTAALRQPDHAASWSSFALTSFELLRLDEAVRASTRALREDPKTAEAWWVRGLLRERRGDERGATRCFEHAAWMDPDAYPLSERLTDEDVEEIVEETLGELHPALREYLANVPILLEDNVPDEVLRAYDPPASPLELLGYFSGQSLQDRSINDAWSQLPGTIVLFRRNLERHATSRAELVDELRVTLFHEVGHFLGLSEEELEKRGLD